MAKIVVEKLNEYQVKNRLMGSWPVWEKEVAKFDWGYFGDKESLIIDGEMEVVSDDGNFIIRKGDFDIFKKGLKCVWDIKKPINKY